MKKIFLMLLATVAISTVATAQTIKPGRVNSAEIIELMPEAKEAREKIEARRVELTEQLGHMNDELQRKYTAFEKDRSTLSGIILEQRQRDIIDLQQKLENFSAEAENDLATYQQTVIAPIFKKVQDAIDKVSKLNLITFVVDESAQPVFVYMNTASFMDLTPKVKAELKLK